jgi:hypothetical protein
MTRTFVLLLMMGLLVSGACRAAGNPALGKWDCTSTDSKGTKVDWALEVTADGDKLSATVTFPGSSPVPLIDPRLDGSTLTFKLQVNETEIVSLKGAIDGKKIEGTFEGHDSGKGTFVGVKAS